MRTILLLITFLATVVLAFREVEESMSDAATRLVATLVGEADTVAKDVGEVAQAKLSEVLTPGPDRKQRPEPATRIDDRSLVSGSYGAGDIDAERSAGVSEQATRKQPLLASAPTQIEPHGGRRSPRAAVEPTEAARSAPPEQTITVEPAPPLPMAQLPEYLPSRSSTGASGAAEVVEDPFPAIESLYHEALRLLAESE